MDWRVYYSVEDATAAIHATSLQIDQNPGLVQAYVERGNAFFYVGDYVRARVDFKRALALDPEAHLALFGKGMALGRSGEIGAGIAALGFYLQHHPQSSLAYTKRGIRYLWLDDLSRAQADFERAIELDGRNAEAHDDLGVIYARRNDYRAAELLFKQAIALDAGYQKAFHNLALVYYLASNNERALLVVNDSLALQADNRDSVMLKSLILRSLGRLEEAEKLARLAESLDTGDWSERTTVD